MQRDFQNKGKSGWTGNSSFVLEVPLRYLRPSTIYSVPCEGLFSICFFFCVFRNLGLRSLHVTEKYGLIAAGIIFYLE